MYLCFLDRLAFVRKQKNKTQRPWKTIGTSGYSIGKYAWGESATFIEVAVKIADAFGLTPDYLVKDGGHEQMGNDTQKYCCILKYCNYDNLRIFYFPSPYI